MALCIAIIGKDSTPMFVSLSPKEKEKQREFDIHLFIYSSLDIVDEKISGVNRSQELYLGVLIADQTFKSYGYVTNTKVKIILVTDVGCTVLKDQEIRLIFKKLHTAYFEALANPFYKPGDPIQSRRLDGAVREVITGN
ncbi:hypothetical protein AB6A40_011478 [Gnathostoma spinigerum]|uniref:Trafficking protein particle complex subunit 2-like protein n=1 Tax=Gnathostoma spinigerum TaxID=75299 RepID=A0ABD6F3G0_9BILA